jgi:hypothetical protein
MADRISANIAELLSVVFRAGGDCYPCPPTCLSNVWMLRFGRPFAAQSTVTSADSCLLLIHDRKSIRVSGLHSVWRASTSGGSGTYPGGQNMLCAVGADWVRKFCEKSKGMDLCFAKPGVPRGQIGRLLGKSDSFVPQVEYSEEIFGNTGQ